MQRSGTCTARAQSSAFIEASQAAMEAVGAAISNLLKGPQAPSVSTRWHFREVSHSCTCTLAQIWVGCKFLAGYPCSGRWAANPLLVTLSASVGLRFSICFITVCLTRPSDICMYLQRTGTLSLHVLEILTRASHCIPVYKRARIRVLLVDGSVLGLSLHVKLRLVPLFMRGGSDRWISAVLSSVPLLAVDPYELLYNEVLYSFVLLFVCQSTPRIAHPTT